MNQINEINLIQIIQYLDIHDIIQLSYTNKYFRRVIKNISFSLLETYYSKEINSIKQLLIQLPNQFHYDLFVSLTQRYKFQEEYFVNQLQSNYNQTKHLLPYVITNKVNIQLVRLFYRDIILKETVNFQRNQLINWCYEKAKEWKDYSLIFSFFTYSNLQDNDSLQRDIDLLYEIGYEKLMYHCYYHDVSYDSLITLLRLLPLVIQTPLNYHMRIILFQINKSCSTMVRNECECCIKLLYQKGFLQAKSIPFLLRRKICDDSSKNESKEMIQSTQKNINKKLELKRKTLQSKQPLLTLRSTIQNLLQNNQ